MIKFTRLIPAIALLLLGMHVTAQDTSTPRTTTGNNNTTPIYGTSITLQGPCQGTQRVLNTYMAHLNNQIIGGTIPAGERL